MSTHSVVEGKNQLSELIDRARKGEAVVSVYLDASVLVALFARDAFTERASTYLDSERPAIVLSDFAAAEFASAVAHPVRMRTLTRTHARAIFAEFDDWKLREANTPGLQPSDLAAAASLVRRLDLPLRIADAINITMAQRIGATLATFDTKMADNARAVGVPVAAV